MVLGDPDVRNPRLLYNAVGAQQSRTLREKFVSNPHEYGLLNHAAMQRLPVHCSLSCHAILTRELAIATYWTFVDRAMQTEQWVGATE